eukprot:m.123447 g.123447  ORF g.123447 m.123447 type:complete len:1382 (-) comp16588_c0_seq1:189-4334(-)
MRVATVAFVALLPLLASADMYLHNMRGSNNRLDEARRDRNNANRLFDSQNNNRGGYNVGRMYYFEGERIPFEWTNQHGCGMKNINDCNIIVQYMCGDNLRDGVTTRTIPRQPSECLNEDCNRDIRYGMHEDYDYYMNCRYRKRNRGLFTADRNLQGNTARFTRQNNNGQRRGYECPEERDYYPYWHPTPWIDLAVITNDDTRCPHYQAQSENVKGRNFCSLPDSWYHHMVRTGGNGNNGFIPNTEPTCTALNAENSGMKRFLKERAEAQHELQEALVKQEVAECETALRECALLSNDETSSLRVDCMNAAHDKFVTEDEITPTTCDAGKALHPVDSCVCLPAMCLTDPAVWVLSTGEGECPEDYVSDPDAADFCILNTTQYASCITDRTPYNNLDKDAERARFMRDADGNVKFFLVDSKTKATIAVDTNDDGTTDSDVEVPLGQCVSRRMVSAECAVSNLEEAFWATAPSHQERWGSVVQNLTCTASEWVRPNSLGNGIGGFTHGWNWTFPADFRSHCAVRLRYNITTLDYDGMDPHNGSVVNAQYNKNNGNNPAKINVGHQQGIASSDSDKPYMNKRGYLFEQNPQVQVFDFYQFRQYCESAAHVVEGDPTKCKVNPSDAESTATKDAFSGYCPYRFNGLDPEHGPQGTVQCAKVSFTPEGARVVGDKQAMSQNDDDFELQLAINTNQFGRTFQDRSHSYQGRERSDDLKLRCGTIHALNVRGKRGNIVQTFPGVEYDFSPNRLHVPEGDCIHFQWTGSNTNPNNNDGQGKQGTDRSNIALMERIRGEGGRGVERYGGKGAQGATWTTDSMEPGWEGFDLHGSPTMADLQCPPRGWPTLVNTHPNNWRKCTDCGKDAFKPRVCEAVEGETDVFVCSDCPAGFVVDPQDDKWCADPSCTVENRPWSSPTWQSGKDPTHVGGGVSFAAGDVAVPNDLRRGSWGTSHPEHLANVTRWGFLGLSYQQLVHLSTLDNVQFGGEMSELDDAGTYFDLPVHKVSGVGTHYYMCTRNNNFSNRSQKGKVEVSYAPEETQVMGLNGGDMWIDTNEGMVSQELSRDEKLILAGYTVKVEPKTLPGTVKMSMQVLTNLSSSAGSDVMRVDPPNLRSQFTFPKTSLSRRGGSAGSRRRDRRAPVQLQSVDVDIWLVNATTVWFSIDSPELEQYVTEWERSVTDAYLRVKFHEGDKVHDQFDVPVGNQFTAEGMWDAKSCDRIRSIEQGNTWVTVSTIHDTDGTPTASFSARLSPDPESGKPIEMTMPVAVALRYGDVFHYQDTAEARECIDGTRTSGCSFLRQKVDTAEVSGGEAKFWVSGSQCLQAGGYYQVSEGSNLPIIVGVTVACVLVALVAVGAAVYFRKHPEKWASAKSFGPNKYKLIKRSFASQV